MSSPSPPAVAAASSTVSSTGPGAPQAAPWVSSATSSTGTPAGISLPSLQHLSSKYKCVSRTWRLRLLYGATSTSAEYSPSTTLASGNVASAAGASDST
jgi:hypothetical protein